MYATYFPVFLYALLAIAHGLPESAASRLGLRQSFDARLATSKHPFIGGAPVPKTAEEITAAQKPGYIYWAAEEQNKRRSTLEANAYAGSGFATAEHAYLGDSLVLKGPNGDNLPPLYNFTFPNGLSLSYGKINCLAGDFYGTYDPISDGTTLADQMQRFKDAYALLATDTDRQPQEAYDILAAAAPEMAAFAAAVADGTDPSQAYADLPDATLDYEKITITRPLDQPGYLGLAAINFDHFGADARTAYNAGHSVALQVAADGDLLTAYTLNAFADHYLEDSFASGHMRTPRRYLHDTVGDADLCSKYMHDEDNAIGLAVTNPNGASWIAHGDNYLMDTTDLDNVMHAHNALQISVAEVWNAFNLQTVQDVSTFGAWAEVPTLVSAGATTQQLAPLFRADGERRSDVTDRHTWDYTSWYTYLGTIATIELSDDWDYPIVMT
ncbi:hypothetical protein GQ53DRAFT_877865 [Thozetella sp. PMI_491]|nr:hypothetical protein GQ53DRAFT_877865 [Thozetella sp. PMI_491]